VLYDYPCKLSHPYQIIRENLGRTFDYFVQNRGYFSAANRISESLSVRLKILDIKKSLTAARRVVDEDCQLKRY